MPIHHHKVGLVGTGSLSAEEESSGMEEMTQSNSRGTPISHRAALHLIADAALAAVDPRKAVLAALEREGDLLRVGGYAVDLRSVNRLFVLGIGKAGAPMAQAVEDRLGERIQDGVVIVKEGHSAPTRHIRLCEAGHPVPTQAGLDASGELLRIAQDAAADDLVICLLSGGGSALLEGLRAGITLADLRRTTDLLLASGADIAQVNTLRKHLSLVKGGRLAAAVAPAQLITLVLSDVIGSPLDVIASGPTVPDVSTWADAWAVVETFGLATRLPAAVTQHLRAGLSGSLPDSPGPGDPIFARAHTVIVADNALAAEAARRAAESLGYASRVVTTSLAGEARDAGHHVVALARSVQAKGIPVQPPACLILGGETTVTLGDSAGKGGRNQELALAAALALEGTEGITVMALATDGSDGPTDSAGAIVDGNTTTVARRLGLDPVAVLQAHDAYGLLDATGALLRTGPTRTNVNDLVMVLVDADES